MDPKKFDPARAHLLDADERERHLPTAAILDLLELAGAETVVDYGAGTGRVAVEVADRLAQRRGFVFAVDESADMLDHLRQRLDAPTNADAMLISDNRVPLPDATVDRILAINLLHEVRGEDALAEMRRLLRPDGFALIVDWERGRPRDVGPPDTLLYTAAEAAEELRTAGLEAGAVGAAFPYHFTLRAIAA